MRVAHVITRLIVGGAQENTIASVLGLRDRHGHEVHLLAGPTTGPEGSLEHLVSHSPGLFKLIPPLVRPVHPWKDACAFRMLVREFRSLKPGIVHTHSGKAGVLGRLAARRADVPVIVHTIHGPSFGDFQGAIANFTFRAAERLAARATTHFVVVAGAMTRQYLQAGIGRPVQYTRIFSGFNLVPFLCAQNDLKLRASLGLAPEDVVVGKIARLTELKGHDDLFDIAPELVKRCPRIKFLLVGDGPWRARLAARAATTGLAGRFVFTGLVPPADIPRLTGIMDLLVHLSRREGLPRALPQGLAAGRPVVAYDCDGAGEVCRPDETGFLVAPGDRAALVAAVERLSADAGLRERFGRNGRAFVETHFSEARMVDELHALYGRLTPLPR